MIWMWGGFFVASLVAAFWFAQWFRDVGSWTIMDGDGCWLQETDPVLWTTDPTKALVVRTLKEAVDCSAYVGQGAQPVSWVEMVVRDD